MHASALLAVVFIAAALLHRRGVRAFIAIPVAATIAPAAVAFACFVYPANPEDQAWAMIAIPSAAAFALVAAVAGCGLAAIAGRCWQRRSPPDA